MRNAARSLFVLTLSFLLQSTALPYLKIGSVMIDLVVISLFAVGYAQGMYAALTAGLYMALIMEVLGGELAGFTTVFCLGAAALGAYVEPRIRGYSRAGKRGRERVLRLIAPILIVGLFTLTKESVFAIYFYLTGAEIRGIHIFRILLSGVLAAFFSFLLLSPICNFVTRPRDKTFIAKWREKRRARRKPELVTLEIPLPPSAEGGSDKK